MTDYNDNNKKLENTLTMTKNKNNIQLTLKMLIYKNNINKLNLQ